MGPLGQYIGRRPFKQSMSERESFGIALIGLLQPLRCPWLPSFHLRVRHALFAVPRLKNNQDVIPYFTVLMSCLRANYVPFPVSPRNSPSAVAHLIFEAGVSHLLVGHEAALVDLAKRAIDILQESHPGFRAPDMSYVPLFDELFLSVLDDRFSAEALPFEYMGPDATACIVHSSGEFGDHVSLEAADTVT